jgi:hypothetical protein
MYEEAGMVVMRDYPGIWLKEPSNKHKKKLRQDSLSLGRHSDQ